MVILISENDKEHIVKPKKTGLALTLIGGFWLNESVEDKIKKQLNLYIKKEEMNKIGSYSRAHIQLVNLALSEFTRMCHAMQDEENKKIV